MNKTRLCVLAVLTASVMGCGQKGPLVLPDAQHAHKKVKFPSPKTPVAPPAAPAQAPSAPAGAAPNAAPPEAAPGSDSTPNPAPQA